MQFLFSLKLKNAKEQDAAKLIVEFSNYQIFKS